MIDEDRYAITCARLMAIGGTKEIGSSHDIGAALEEQVNKLSDEGYRPIDMTSSQDIACVLMKKG